MLSNCTDLFCHKIDYSNRLMRMGLFTPYRLIIFQTDHLVLILSNWNGNNQFAFVDTKLLFRKNNSTSQVLCQLSTQALLAGSDAVTHCSAPSAIYMLLQPNKTYNDVTAGLFVNLRWRISWHVTLAVAYNKAELRPYSPHHANTYTPFDVKAHIFTKCELRQITF